MSNPAPPRQNMRGPADEPRAAREPGNQAPAAASPPPLRIFLVENNPDTRELMGLLLAQAGHVVGSAATMAAALEAIPAFAADMLISDIGLDDGTGWELLGLLGESRPPYAIAMSGFGTPVDRENSRAAGFRHHLLKPVVPASLDLLLDEVRQERGGAR